MIRKLNTKALFLTLALCSSLASLCGAYNDYTSELNDYKRSSNSPLKKLTQEANPRLIISLLARGETATSEPTNSDILESKAFYNQVVSQVQKESHDKSARLIPVAPEDLPNLGAFIYQASRTHSLDHVHYFLIPQEDINKRTTRKLVRQLAFRGRKNILVALTIDERLFHKHSTKELQQEISAALATAATNVKKLEETKESSLSRVLSFWKKKNTSDIAQIEKTFTKNVVQLTQ